MAEQEDGRTPGASEASFGEFLARPEHRQPKDAGKVRPNDTPTDVADEPDWHKQGKATPPGWRVVGDTFAEG